MCVLKLHQKLEKKIVVLMVVKQNFHGVVPGLETTQKHFDALGDLSSVGSCDVHDSIASTSYFFVDLDFAFFLGVFVFDFFCQFFGGIFVLEKLKFS